MVKLLLSLCLAVLEAVLPCSGSASGGTRDVGRLATAVKGRVLLFSLQKGMTPEQVEHLLGRPDACRGFGLGAVDEYWWYSHYDVQVVVIGWKVAEYGYIHRE
jgi:hypothetical protein